MADKDDPQAFGIALDGTTSALASPLPPNCCFAFPFALCGRLLVEPALPKLGIEPRALNLPLEAAQSAIEAFVVLNRNFHRYHTPHKTWKKRISPVT